MKTIQWYPGHMAKTKRLIREKIKYIDIIFELLDARAPYASQNPMIREITKNKPRILLLNKTDLADREVTNTWLQHFKKEGLSAMPINSLEQLPVDKIVSESKRLLKDVFDKESKRGRLQRPIRAMIIGIPNVGKSTLINQLVRKRVTKVGDVAGITKHLQVIRIHEDMELLDTPGILWPKFEDQEVAKKLVLVGSLKDSVVALDDIVIYGIQFLIEHYKAAFEKRYDIRVEGQEMVDIFELIGKRRGCLKKGGIVDYERVIDIFLHDFRNQQFGPISLDRIKDYV